MPNWMSRLEVHVNGATLTPITTFQTTFSSSITQIHSIEMDNVGVIIKPQTMTFMMTVPAIGGTAASPSVKTLYELAVAGMPFDVGLSINNGSDWVFSSLLFSGCYITSANPSNVSIGTTSGQLDTVPVATFTGIVTKFTDGMGHPLPPQ